MTAATSHCHSTYTLDVPPRSHRLWAVPSALVHFVGIRHFVAILVTGLSVLYSVGKSPISAPLIPGRYKSGGRMIRRIRNTHHRGDFFFHPMEASLLSSSPLNVSVFMSFVATVNIRRHIARYSSTHPISFHCHTVEIFLYVDGSVMSTPSMSPNPPIPWMNA